MCVTALPSNSRATSVKQTATAARSQQDQLEFLLAQTLPQPGIHIIAFARRSGGRKRTGGNIPQVGRQVSVARCRYPGPHDLHIPNLAVFPTHSIQTSEAATKRGNAQKRKAKRPNRSKPAGLLIHRPFSPVCPNTVRLRCAPAVHVHTALFTYL